MRVSSIVSSTCLVVAVVVLVAPAFADGFDGTYLGTSTLKNQSQDIGGSRFRCTPSSEVRYVISGQTIQSENLDTGLQGSGVIQPDGSFTTHASRGTGTQSSTQGKIDSKGVHGTFTTLLTGGLKCEGTVEATRR